MFDFSEFRKYLPSTNYELILWENHPPDKELYAKEIYKRIDDNVLRNYLSDIVSECKSTVSHKATHSYSKTIDSLKRKYGSGKVFNHNKLKYHSRIINLYNSNHIIRKIKDECLNSTDCFITKLISHIDRIQFHIFKLLYITNLKNTIEDWFLNEKIYLNFISDTINSFEDLFRSEQEFIYVMEDLMNKNLISFSNEKYSWVGIDSELTIAPKKMLCVLSFALNEKGYYKNTKLPHSKMAEFLGNYFNMNINDSYYSKNFKKYMEIKNYDSNVQLKPNEQVLTYFKYLPSSILL